MAVKRVKKVNKVKAVGLSNDTKTILVVVTLLLAYPVGLILMFMWMKWPAWLKILISLPVFLMALMMLVMLFLVLINPYPGVHIYRT